MFDKRRSGFSTYSLLPLIVFTLLVASFAAAEAKAGANRPAGVPADFVITPFGYFHPSCVNHLVEGDILRQDVKAIEHANGSLDKIPVCAYPHYRGDGEKVFGDERGIKDPNISHAWVEWADVNTTYDYGDIYAEWDVPPTPSSHDGQTLYFFNGLEDINDVVTIIQPVLGWNSDYGSAWGIAAWNCCVNGATNEASPAHANQGDHIEGYVFPTCGATKTCSTWDIVIIDQENGNYSQMVNTTSYGQTFNWAFGGVMEVYNIAQCSDYPASEESGTNFGITFYNQELTNYKGQRLTPAWKIGTATGLSPSCNYGGSQPKVITLTY